VKTKILAVVLALACLGATVPEPPLESNDFLAHFNYGKQQGTAAEKAEGEVRKSLATEAVQHLRRATELDPTAGGAWVLLAYSCLVASCNANETERAAQKALDLMPGDHLATWVLANQLINNGQGARARTMLRPLLEVDSPIRDSLRVAHVRARLDEAGDLYEAGKTKEAEQLLADGPLPEGKEAREKAQMWIDGLREYWKGRPDLCAEALMGASRAGQAGQREKARKMFEDVIAHCPDKEVVKMARTELELMDKARPPQKK